MQKHHAGSGRGALFILVAALPRCDLKDPLILVQFTGQPVSAATKYEPEVWRCSSCRERYPAPLPEGVTEEKYTATADATIALMKYGGGLPFYRLAGLQRMCGVPLPESVQFERCTATANTALPVFLLLQRLAADGEVLYADDTRVKILDWEQEKKGLEDRCGTQTSGMVVEVEGHHMAWYASGRKHAGENLDELLATRSVGLAPPIQMRDALAANWSGEAETIGAKCLAHARRKFYELKEIFPAAGRVVLEAIGQVYQCDAETGEMSGEERLRSHQKHSRPVMSELKEWIEQQFRKDEVEPKSALGEALRYLLRDSDGLVKFLSVAKAPIDNNAAERALKRCVLFRKHSLFFKTEHGAAVGDILASLIETCRLNGVNPWDYLVDLRKKGAEVRRNPALCRGITRKPKRRPVRLEVTS